MASIYTHHRFGRLLIEQLPLPLQTITKKHLDYYLLGQQGPDIFFFNPFFLMKSNSPGMVIHAQSGQAYIEKQISHLKDKKLDTPEMAYFIGTLCHFILDAIIHPSVNALVNANITHLEIETELDRYYMLADNENPQSFRQDKLIANNPSFANVLYPFYQNYQGITKRQIKGALFCLRQIKKIFHNSSLRKEKVLFQLLKSLKFSDFTALIMTHQPNEEATQMYDLLTEKFDHALAIAPNMIEIILQYILTAETLPEICYLNYEGENV